MSPSAHIDTFARDHLPPRELWPEFLFDLPELQFPPRLNCAAELLDRWVQAGQGERRCVVAADGTAWSYGQLLAHANRIARVLVDDLGVVPATACCCAAPTRRCSRRAGSASSRRGRSPWAACRCCARAS
jgi:2-aminobenzoate-CoA ligase